MLKIKFRQEESSHPLQAICPWIDFLSPEVVLNKDGSLLAGFEYTGLDPDNLYDDMINASTEQMERAYKPLDERITAWWIVDKRKDSSYTEMSSTNPASCALDKHYSKSFKGGKHYTIRYYFFMLFSGSTGTDKFLDRVARLQEEGQSLGSSMISALRESLSGKAAFARDSGLLYDNAETFKRIIRSFMQAAPVRLNQLEGSDFESALSSILNRATPPRQRRKPAGTMLDSWLPLDWIETSKEVIKFKNNSRTVYAGALALVAWPQPSTPQLFESIAQMDVELTICQVIRFLGTEKSRAAINAAIEYYKLTQFSMIAHAVAKASGQEPEPKPGKQDLLLECNEALEDLEANGTLQAYHNATVFVYGRTPRELTAHCELVERELGAKKFDVVREMENTGPSFASMLPGQWSQQVRYDLLSVPNVADATPIYTMQEGSRIHPFFSKQVFRKEVPALAVFGNRYGGHSYFVPHVGQVGHMLIVAPTGGGKTTMVNFCLSQFQRYEGAKTFVFDRDLSCMITSELHGGTHVYLKNEGAKLNPFFAMMDGSPDGLNWTREYIINRLLEGGYSANATDREEIDLTLAKLRSQYETTGHRIRMSTLATQLPRHLETELGEWLEGRPYGMFDNEEDDFALSDWTTIEMKEIMGVERLSRAFLEYAFRKIEVSLTGEPTIIYLEEASFLLNNPQFKDMLDTWLKTFRKKNAFVWMTIQSPESITNADIAATLLDNVKSFLLCVNKRIESHRHAYKHFFGLDDQQVDLIRTLQPNREYLLIQETTSRVLTTDFDKNCLAYLRSEQAVINTYLDHKSRGGPNWQEQYLATVAQM